ncbi:IclR family transcriptional regulator [Natranaeroarchaeum sulfidigenes]|nr:IclR family transcriptional regulator [Natranaeroarchaeum sulfidigenes]
MSDPKNRYIKSVEHALDIVEHVSEQGPIGVSELAKQIDMPKSTVYVHLQTLKKHGYINKEDDKYDIGLRFLETGSYARRRRGIYRSAREEVDKLASEVEEAAHLGVEQNGKRVILYKSEFGDAIYDNTSTGEFTHMHWTAIGKVLLAHMTTSRVTEIVKKHGLPSATSKTITDKEDLFDALERIRDRGIAVENEERRSGVVAIAVPIFDTTTGDVVAAISVSGPRQRIVMGEEEEIKQDIIEAVRNRANVAELRYNHY